MREDVKTRLCGAAAALSTAIVSGALQAKRLGPNPFALQITATVIVLSWIPYLHRIKLFGRVPTALSGTFGLAWVLSCLLPVFKELIVELFTGHRRPGMNWYNALWRIYAILALWIGFAVLNERVIRPWWKDNSDRFLGSIRDSSVSSQARKIALDKRTMTLEALKSRMKLILSKKKLAENTIVRKKAEIEKAQANIERADRMYRKAQKTASESGVSAKVEADDVVETMKDMLDNAISHEKSLHADVEQLEVDLQELKVQQDELQREWTEALHIQNYTGFYR